MTGNEFHVHTDTLRSVAGMLGDRGQEASRLAQQANDADVDTKSWGLLGLGLGLYAGYTSARDTANHSIGEVTAFLQHARTALQSTARDYDEADAAGGKLFAGIDSELGDGS